MLHGTNTAVVAEVIVAVVHAYIQAQYFTAIANTKEFYLRRRRRMQCGATSIDEDKY